jgi:nucleoside triphosphate diphosphatase
MEGRRYDIGHELGMQDNSPLGRAMATVRDLRRRCAWDRAQTRETLRPYLVEEVLELDQALSEGEVHSIRDELSDLLLHLAFQLVIAEERNEFSPGQIADQLEVKMRRRHPHLFDQGKPEPWEQIKRRERRGRVLEGLVPTLPSLLMAFRLQERAASVGFDWPDATGPLEKVREELVEVEAHLPTQAASAATKGDPNEPGRGPTTELTEEIGDLLFAVVNLARKSGVPPGPALDRANRKFRERFERVEQLAEDRGIEMATAGLTVLDKLWDEVKDRAKKTEKTERTETTARARN